MMHRTRLATLLLAIGLAAPGSAQELIQLVTKGAIAAGTLNASTTSITIDTAGQSSIRIQTLDSYSGTWEVQCSVDGTTFDTDDEVLLSLEGATTTPAASVTDLVGIWSASIAGCRKIQIVATAGFAATDTSFAYLAVQSGGSSGGGGAGGAGGTDGVAQASATAGQNGVLSQGAVTTAAPTYTTATTNPLSMDTNGALRVAITSGAGSGGTSVADRTGTFTPGTTSFTLGGGYMDDTSPDACTEGQPCTFRITSTRSLHTNTSMVGGLAVPIEDIAFTDSGTGFYAMTRRVDTTPTSTAGTTGDNAFLNTDSIGRLWVIQAGLGTEDIAETADGPLEMIGTVRRDTAASSAGTTGDNATLNTDSTGRLWINPGYIGVEDVAETAATNLAMVGSVRRDTAASSAGTTGDNATINTDSTGLLWVRIGASDVSTAGGTSLADDADFTTGTTVFTPVGGLYQSTVTACTDGDTCAVGITTQRTMKTTLYSAAGAELTPSLDVTEDVAEAGAETGPLVMTVRRDTLASSAGSNLDFATLNTDSIGALYTRFSDPCTTAKSVGTFSISSATTTQLVSASSGNYVYVCSINLVAGGANNVALVEDDTAACASPSAGMAGGVTATTGWNFAANGGIALGSGVGTVAKTSTTNRYVCLMTSSTAQTSGTVSYVLAP